MTERKGYWRKLGDEVYCYVHDRDGWGWSNVGVVFGPDHGVLIDAMGDEQRTARMLSELSDIAGARPLAAAAITGPDGAHHFGAAALPEGLPTFSSAATYESITIASRRRLAAFADIDDGPVSRYIHCKLDGLMPDPSHVRPPTAAFADEHSLSVGRRKAQITELLSTGESIVHVPDVDVVFAGGLCRTNGVPMPTLGSLNAHLGACHHIAALKPAIVVPGHGAPIGRLGLEDTIHFLEHVRSEATPLLLDGQTVPDTAARLPMAAFSGWADLEWLIAHVAAVHADLGLPQPWNGVQLLLSIANQPRLRLVNDQ